MAEVNVIKTPDMGIVNGIDFVNSFERDLTELRELLGLAKPISLAQGNAINLYKYVVTRPTDPDAAVGLVPEGDDIPLTHVKADLDRTLNLDIRKYRKAVTLEEVQRVGYERASNASTRAVLADIQGDIKDLFFSLFEDSPVALDPVTNLQEGVASAWGEIKDRFGNNGDVVVFINPKDAGKYLGTSAIENGQSVGFGLTLLGGFTETDIIVTNGVPQGSYYATSKDNLVIAHIDVNGNTRQMFHSLPHYTDDTGLIAYVLEPNTTNATEQAMIYSGILFYPEVVNGVLKGTIEEAVAGV